MKRYGYIDITNINITFDINKPYIIHGSFYKNVYRMDYYVRSS